MADRTCSACGKVFKWPSGLDRHKQRKNPCVLPAAAEAPLPTYKCRHCDEVFTKQSNRSRHENHRCAARPPSRELAIPQATTADIAELRKQLEAQLETIKAVLASAPLPVASAAAPGIVQSAETMSNVRGNVGQMNNVGQLNNSNFNFAPQQPVLNFGEEDVSAYGPVIGTMLDGMIEDSGGEAVLSETCRNIWRNPDHPQNMTVYIPNKRDNVPHVMTPTGWEARSGAEVYPQILDKACTVLEKNQQHDVGYTPSGLEKLSRRGRLQRAAFDAELVLKTQGKDLEKLLRPVLLRPPAQKALAPARVVILPDERAPPACP